jgi:hypothetical protein
VPGRAERPKYEADYQNDHSDCPHDWYTSDESDEEKNQAKNNHDASRASKEFFVTPTATNRRFERWCENGSANYMIRK